ncbi:MAG: winged helix-turn-helix domain-containing protein [Candidatus Helarchaeota archaeon]
MTNVDNENIRKNEDILRFSDDSAYWWVFGRKGGDTREKIMNLLLTRPYNAHQISEILQMSYRNIKHHLKVLQDASFIIKNDQKYGKIYLVSPNFNQNVYNKICKKTSS